MTSPFDRLLESIPWETVKEVEEEPIEGELPHITHKGVLKIMDVEIQVYQLSNGMRIIPEEEFYRLGLLPLPGE
jgi:hypothetical protein